MLLDIVMPEMDGVEACARIRNDARYADLPIIMVTSLDDMNSLANAFVAGATDYITKPVNRVELVARVRAALRLKQELDRRQARERELLSFLSNWGDRRANLLIDEATGLFVGEAAEAYLTALARRRSNDEVISILALTLDRFDAYRAANGEDGRAQACLPKWRARCAGSPRRSASWRRPIATASSFWSRPRSDPSPRASSARRCARRYRNCACRIPNRSCPTTSPQAWRPSPAGSSARSIAFSCSRRRSPGCRTPPARAAIAFGVHKI